MTSSLLEETNASGAAQADYIYLDGRPVAVLNGSTLYYLHTDRLGTPQLATDSNEAVQWQASYDPFGQASVSGTITQNLRLPGQYFDLESGWNHNGFRDYLPTLGRYAEPDPLGRLGSGNNLYVYVGDNPVNLTDPLGLCPFTCHDLAAGKTPPGNNFSNWLAGEVNANNMFSAWALGYGNTSTDFGSDSVESQQMMSAYGLAGDVASFLSGGPASGHQDFGVGGLLSTGLNPTAQFVGSYDYSFSLSGGYLNITLTNPTDAWSFFYHPSFLNPNPPIRPSDGWNPMGRVNQIYHITVPCS